MNDILRIKADFEAVYLFNGTFAEKADRLNVRSDEVIYITVLPLSAALLPYTVKFAGGKIRNNEELARAYEIDDRRYIIRLSPRYNYVYSPTPHESRHEFEGGIVPRFFAAAIKNETDSARKCLTAGLNASVNDAALSEFFDGYEEIIPNDGFTAAPPNSWFLIDRNGKATLFTFTLKSGLIDDITEKN